VHGPHITKFLERIPPEAGSKDFKAYKTNSKTVIFLKKQHILF
jgi:hypothetical protein